jgi:hypothetical protein
MAMCSVAARGSYTVELAGIVKGRSNGNNMDKIEAALRMLAIEIASNRTYVSTLRGEGGYAETVEDEEKDLLERLDRKLHPENWQ